MTRHHHHHHHHLTLAEAVAQLERYTSDEIAALLRAADKHGHPGEGESCPLANYFIDVLALSQDDWVNVEHEEVFTAGETASLPEGAQTFVRRFDRGWYADLQEGWL